jgi:hypothetical protein
LTVARVSKIEGEGNVAPKKPAEIFIRQAEFKTPAFLIGTFSQGFSNLPFSFLRHFSFFGVPIDGLFATLCHYEGLNEPTTTT